ncbi:phage Gp37/Gp68 family protein [Terasakiella sp.]|uniref:phage Gp37/Gp68 family protein n=1 Tax=Terasakiella sp. TaxID=2034861 RepID=UPI003AA7BE59
MSKIEWTDKTWNPIAGCAVVSEGCKNCYAINQAMRNAAMGCDKYVGTTRKSGTKHVWTGKINFDEKALLAPLKRKTPTRYFVNSMSDLFHENVPDEWIDKIFAVMALCPQHTFQVLTKRPERMREFYQNPARDDLITWAQAEFTKRFQSQTVSLPNVWLGVSIEDQATANERIPLLLDTPAAVRWVSAEPLLGPVIFGSVDIHGIGKVYREKVIDHLDWVVVGGESGPGARPMHPEWADELRGQCEMSGVPFLFKQWGEWAPYDRGQIDQGALVSYGATWRPLIKIGKKLAGRLMHGKTFDQYPEAGQ